MAVIPFHRVKAFNLITGLYFLDLFTVWKIVLVLLNSEIQEILYRLCFKKVLSFLTLSVDTSGKCYCGNALRKVQPYNEGTITVITSSMF